MYKKPFCRTPQPMLTSTNFDNLLDDMQRILFFIFLNFLCICSAAQTSLTAADSSFLARTKSLLQLSPQQVRFADSLFLAKGAALKQVENELFRLQRSNLPEDSIATYSTVLANKRKDLRNTRDMELRFALTPDQQITFDQQIKATKPQVLHFGVHNRADCVVCKSPSP